MTAPTLIRPEQLDITWQVPRGTCEKLARAGKIPHTKLPDGSIRFMPADAARITAAGHCDHPKTGRTPTMQQTPSYCGQAAGPTGTKYVRPRVDTAGSPGNDLTLTKQSVAGASGPGDPGLPVDRLIAADPETIEFPPDDPGMDLTAEEQARLEALGILRHTALEVWKAAKQHVRDIFGFDDQRADREFRKPRPEIVEARRAVHEGHRLYAAAAEAVEELRRRAPDSPIGRFAVLHHQLKKGAARISSAEIARGGEQRQLDLMRQSAGSRPGYVIDNAESILQSERVEAAERHVSTLRGEFEALRDQLRDHCAEHPDELPLPRPQEADAEPSKKTKRSPAKKKARR